jgi:hypothetical protein
MEVKEGVRDLKNEVTLADIAEVEAYRDKKLSYGIIIDVSEPFRYENRDEYVTKLKIVDPTFNYKAFINNENIKFHKFVTVHIYSNWIAKSPKIKNVGDILRLRRFNFVVTPKGELVGYLNKYSNWLVYQGKKGASFKPTSYKDIDKNFDREMSQYERNRIDELRDWSRDFFAQNSIKYVTWWSELREPTDEDLSASGNKYVANEVDLLLKTEKVLKDKKAVEFVDHVNQKYALFLQAPPVLVKDEVIKLRCVNVIFTPEGRIIQLTKNSSCLIIFDYFFDARLFNKKSKVSPAPSHMKTPERRLPSVKKDSAGRYTTPMSTKRAATALYPFLNDYDYEDTVLNVGPANKKGVESGSATLVKKSYVHKVPTSVKDLFGIMENPQAYEHNRFVVSGYILGASDYKLNKIVKKMDDNGKIYDMSDDTSRVAGDVRHVFHFILFLKDQSVENVDRFLNVYVLTNESDQNLFDLWNMLPRSNDAEGWEALEDSKVSDFEGKFKALKNYENKVKFVVELLITNTGKPFLKLYDTIFLP